MITSCLNLYNILPYTNNDAEVTLDCLVSIYPNEDLDLDKMKDIKEEDLLGAIKEVGYRIDTHKPKSFIDKFMKSYAKKECLTSTQYKTSFTKNFTGKEISALL